jgi:hypothetical protein
MVTPESVTPELPVFFKVTGNVLRGQAGERNAEALHRR